MTRIRLTHQAPTMADLFQELLQSDFGANPITKPAANIVETENAFELSLLVPGFQKESFKIEVEKNLLTISADVKTDANEAAQKPLRQEFGITSFKRNFTLNNHIDTELIEAHYLNGILAISLPKKQLTVAQLTKQIAVN